MNDVGTKKQKTNKSLFSTSNIKIKTMTSKIFIIGKVSLLGLLMMLCIGACKYKDGPAISFRSPETRIIGNYEAEAFTVDGTDALQIWKDSISDIIFSIYHDTDPTDNYWISARVGDAFLAGNYKLTDNDTRFYLYSLEENAAYPGFGPFHGNAESYWDLYKLSKTRIWMQTDFEGHTYYVELKQIE